MKTIDELMNETRAKLAGIRIVVDAAGRTVQRKTGIAVDMQGKTPKETRKMAQQLADVMEQAAKAKVMEVLNDAVKPAERDGMEGCNEGSKFAVSRQ